MTAPGTALPGRPCSIAAALDMVGDRWALLAVREIGFGNTRFTDIARNTGAPRDRLAARLRALVDAGVLERTEYQQSPPRSDYHLTAAGRDLAPVLNALLAWGDRWAVDAPPVTLHHHVDGHSHVLDGRWVCRTCGQPIRGRDVTRTSNVAGWDLQGPVGQAPTGSG